MSIHKGSGFERRIAKQLSEWSGIELCRTPMSGAHVVCEKDIWPKDTKQVFPLAVECKCVEGWDLHQLMLGNGSFFSWLDQAIEQTDPGEITFLVFKANRRPTYVCLPSYVMIQNLRPILCLKHNSQEYIVLTLDLLFAEVTYDSLTHPVIQ